jgi:hypothetical protein
VVNLALVFLMIEGFANVVNMKIKQYNSIGKESLIEGAMTHPKPINGNKIEKKYRGAYAGET